MKIFNINYHFNSLDEISLGVNICLSDPCIQIHLPFGFIRIGWLEEDKFFKYKNKLFTFSSRKIIMERNMLLSEEQNEGRNNTIVFRDT